MKLHRKISRVQMRYNQTWMLEVARLGIRERNQERAKNLARALKAERVVARRLSVSLTE